MVQRHLFTGKLIFFKNLCFQQPLRSLKRSYYFYPNCQNIFLALVNRFLMYVTLDNLRKNGANAFVHCKTAFFSKICVFSNLSGPKKNSYYLHINCQNNFLSLITRLLRFVTLDNLRKNGANTFVHWKTAFCSKVCVFSKSFWLFESFSEVCQIRQFGKI